MRICAVSLPELRIEVARDLGEVTGVVGTAPLAIVVAPSPMTEATLLGNTRLDVVSREARALGVRAGQTIAQARARAAGLAVRVVRPEAVQDVLARLAEVALAFGATVSFRGDTGSSKQSKHHGDGGWGDIVWVDVTGCAHLHAGPGVAMSEGEGVLATRLANAIHGLGYECTVAIADGPRIAAMLARALGHARVSPPSSPSISAMESAPSVMIVPPGKNAAAIGMLSVASLPLPEEDVRWLAKVGVRTVEELRALPRASLAARLGARASAVLTLAEGDDRAPLAPYVPPEIPEESVVLEYGIHDTSALVFVAKTLCDRLSARLSGRAVATSSLELELVLDHAMLGPGVARDEAKESVRAELPMPLSVAGDLLSALRAKVERLTLRAPVLSAKLRAGELAPRPSAALSLFDPLPKAGRLLPRLVAELAADIGAEAIGTLALGDAWSPDDRSRFVPWSREATQRAVVGGGSVPAKPRKEGKKRRHLLSSVPEPTRILAEPTVVGRDTVRVVRHLCRLEGAAWWKESSRAVDFVQAWAEDGSAWVEIDRRTGATRIRGWFD